MGVFAFDNGFPETGNVLVDKSEGEQADFDVDTDASDAETHHPILALALTYCTSVLGINCECLCIRVCKTARVWKID